VIVVDEEHGRIIIVPVQMAAFDQGIDAEFATQVNDFIEQYRPALKKLAEYESPDSLRLPTD
jgi:hypothetical protein